MWMDDFPEVQRLCKQGDYVSRVVHGGSGNEPRAPHPGAAGTG